MSRAPLIIEGSTACVTGASSGIGAEFARQLHAKGAALVLVARRREKLHQLAATLNATRAGSVTILPADLSREESEGEVAGLRAAIEFLQNTRIDILVNNAGMGSFGHFEELDIGRESSMVSLNVTATLRLAHAVIPQMKERGSGAIVSISSIAAFQPLPYMATYAATKAFNFIHSMALRYELRRFGVRVLTVCPGPTATEFGGVARVPGTLTGGRRDSVSLVVERSLAALAADRPFVVTGTRSKLLYGLMCLAPWRLSSRLAAEVLGISLRRASQLGHKD